MRNNLADATAKRDHDAQPAYDVEPIAAAKKATVPG